MWRVREWLLRLVNALRPGRSEVDLDREVRAHLALLEDEYHRRGLSAVEARLAAQRVMGQGDLVKEQHREARSFRPIEDLRRDVLQSLRLLRHHYRTTTAAILTVGLAIGAVTVVFSVFEAVVLRALPGSGADRLLSVAYAAPGRSDRSGLGHLELADAKPRWQCFDLVGSYKLANLTTMGGLTGDQQVVTSVVSPTFFDLFGAQPVLGRTFIEEDGAPDRERVVVLAFALWRQQFGGDPEILGRSIHFDGRPYRVVGVMPADFLMPVGWIQAWLPDVDSVQERNYAGLTHQVIARLKPGWSVEQARRALLGEPARLMHFLRTDAPVLRAPGSSEQVAQLSLVPLRDELVGPVGFAATLLLVVVVVVMAIACVNVAMLVLSRNAARQREFAVRLALGSTRHRLTWQSWLDSVLVSLGGGVLGAAIAFPSLRLIRDLGPLGVPRLREAVVDGHVFVVALVAVAATTVVTGLLPGLRIAGSSLTVTMGGGSRPLRDRVGLLARIPLEGLLTTAQVALVVLLVTVASLLLRSVTQILTIDPGFHAGGLMVIQFESARTPDPELEREVMDELRRIPGVESVAAAMYLKSVPMMAGLMPEGSPGATFDVTYQIASAPFFSTLGIPILEGRTFSPDEHANGPCTIVINRTLAEAVWPGQRRVGRVINAGRPCEVIGVVGDVRFHVETKPGYQVYFPGRSGSGTFFIRLTQDRSGVRSTVLARARSMDPSRRIGWTGSVTDVLFDHVVTPPFYAFVFGWFAALALVLAAVGVYGMMSQVVARRWQEIGVRLAIGAEPSDIRAMVLRHAAALLGAGIVVGLCAAIGIGRWVGSMLYNLTPSDPIALSVACGVVLVVGLLAAFIPSQRASRIDPVLLFRVE